MKSITINILAVALATISFAAALATPATLAKRGGWWGDDDADLDTALPPRFTLNVTSPGGEFDNFKIFAYSGYVYAWDENMKLAPPDFNVDPWEAPAYFFGDGNRFYYEPKGENGRRLYMDIFAQETQLVRFRSLDSVHYHAGYTFDGFSMLKDKLVRRYDMNDRYRVRPKGLWQICPGGDSGEADLIWDSPGDPDAPPFVQALKRDSWCTSIEFTIIPV